MRATRLWEQWEEVLRTNWYVKRGGLFVMCVFLALCFLLVLEWENGEESSV